MSAVPEAAAAPSPRWERVPVADALEIGTVLARCARLVDARAWDELGRVFAEDAVLAAPDGTAAGLAGIVERARADTLEPHHVTDTVLRRLDGDRVRAWSKWFLVRGDGAVLGGEQLDLLVRTPGGWRIAERRIARPDPGRRDAGAALGVADFLA